MKFPESPAPLSNQDTYTTWPGGVDPTARVYDSVGGAAKKRRSTPKRRYSRKGRKAMKARRKTRRY